MCATHFTISRPSTGNGEKSQTECVVSICPKQDRETNSQKNIVPNEISISQPETLVCAVQARNL